jgi:hypothetical protein
MKTYAVNRYTFNELKGEARELAIKKMQERLSRWLDEQEITDYLEYEVEKELGALPNDITLNYSLSYCQGDGVAIYGRIKKEEAPTLTWPEGVAYIELVKNSWGTHYSHWNTFNVEFYDEEGEWKEGSEVIEKQLREVCRVLEYRGYKYIEDQTNEASAIEYLEQNYEDEFTLAGNLDPITITDTEEIK